MRTIQARNATGGPATGLTWTSSDPAVVSLSAANPPELTAVAAGHATITAGPATVAVTVAAADLPIGTVLWSNPGNGSGVTKIVPAVPSPSGVADVFAFQADGTVQAIASDGTTAWTANVGGPGSFWNQRLPDFQGGLIVVNALEGNGSIVKLDGMDGHGYPVYTPTGTSRLEGMSAVHTDGTIFTIQRDTNSLYARSVAGIDPLTGAKKFEVPLEQPSYLYDLSPLGLIIAGDGYAYVPYQQSICNAQHTPQAPDEYRLKLLRISSSGTYDNISIASRSEPAWCEIPALADVGIITNADTGAMLTWNWDNEYRMATVTGTTVALGSAPHVPDQSGTVRPVLQAQDGSFVGTAYVGDDHTPYMVAFDATGAVRWTVPGYQPQIATADGGVIAQLWDSDSYKAVGPGVMFDQIGNATEQGRAATSSWIGKTYSVFGGSLLDLVQPVPSYASSFEAVAGGNLSGNATAVPFLTLIEGIPLFAAAGKGSGCQLGSAKVPLAGPALDQYASQKQALLAGNYLTSPACSVFFSAAGRSNYFSLLTSAVMNQTPYDGPQTTISLYQAGFWNAHDENKPTFPAQWQKTAVCQTFNISIVAEAQIQPQAADVYINTNPKVWKKFFTQSTILHEALHNLTGLQDPALAEVLGTSPTSTGATTPINTVLVQNGCAAK